MRQTTVITLLRDYLSSDLQHRTAPHLHTHAGISISDFRWSVSALSPSDEPSSYLLWASASPPPPRPLPLSERQRRGSGSGSACYTHAPAQAYHGAGAAEAELVSSVGDASGVIAMRDIAGDERRARRASSISAHLVVSPRVIISVVGGDGTYGLCEFGGTAGLIMRSWASARLKVSDPRRRVLGGGLSPARNPAGLGLEPRRIGGEVDGDAASGGRRRGGEESRAITVGIKCSEPFGRGRWKAGEARGEPDIETGIGIHSTGGAGGRNPACRAPKKLRR